MNISVYTLTSPLHDESSVALATEAFLNSLNFQYTFKGEDFTDYKHSGNTKEQNTCSQPALKLIYVRTGGTENLFKKLYSSGCIGQHPIYLLASDKSNSLAASMEIMSWILQNGLQGEIIHGSTKYISNRVNTLATIEAARHRLAGIKAAIIGKPSDWLISSTIDAEQIRNKLGFEIKEIPIAEVQDEIASISSLSEESKALQDMLNTKVDAEACGIKSAATCGIGDAKTNAAANAACNIDDAKTETTASVGTNNNANNYTPYINGAVKIYEALKRIVAKHKLNAFTIRCFDLLTALQNTGCVALSKLNSDGVIAGCEGDMPAMLSMIIANCLTGKTGFQANPSKVDIETGEILFAHCTIPFNLVERYELDTHFESGIGVGIRGFMKKGPVTVFKVSGNLQRFFAEEGELIENGSQANLCRTQQLIRFNDKSACKYFLQEPIGNHHIIIPGNWKKQISDLLK